MNLGKGGSDSANESLKGSGRNFDLSVHAADNKVHSV